MLSFLKKSLRWLLLRIVTGCLLAALGLAGYAWWLYAHDPLDLGERQQALLENVRVEREYISVAKLTTEGKMLALHHGIQTEQARIEDAARAIEVHHNLESSWQRWFGDKEQQEINDKRREEQEKNKTEAEAKLKEFKNELITATLEHELVEIEAARIDVREREIKSLTSKWKYYARTAWEQGNFWALVFLAAFLVWPGFCRAVLYYAIAPFVVRRKPLRLLRDKAAEQAPALVKTGEEVTVDLWPGEALWTKENFLESADSGLARGKRFMFQWRYPFTSIACGLLKLAELKNAHAGRTQRVFLEGARGGKKTRHAHAELAIVQVPEGASLVLRPRFLAGVVAAHDAPLVIRSHWRIFSWHSWVTGQFRFLVFEGPCRLIVASRRGVQAEELLPREDGRRPVRRANEWATIGFTPTLAYRPARAESFWSYCVGLSPLYDDLFIGTGLFFIQKTAPGQGRFDKGFLRPFVASCWRNFQKVFGM